ncbi:DUF2971 domain-containing protein [Chromohalobacter sp.]|uniref:DUF2971 domain-containing protein n=1 Tax=Chromohalobacter sp. TaxID=50740 RepID=UPI002590CA63|nr:DUF2971 domain-containing protein [Chromohalobacter sp.]MCI0594379.1 hypothetical protein [Chromohalobacter sp.]
MSDLYVWRYMSLAKYVDMLRSRSIFCPKASLFQDETEGKWIAHAILWGEKQRWQRIRGYADRLQSILDRSGEDQNAVLVGAASVYNQLTPEEESSVLGDVLKQVPLVYPHKRQEYLERTVESWLKHHDGYNPRVSKWLNEVTIDRDSTYISCWNRADSMSLAMWNLYGGGSESVAIRLERGKLETLLEKNLDWLKENGLDGQVVDVDYVDGLNSPGEELQENLVDRLGVGKDVRVGAFSVKPALYAYESEVRLIVYPKRDIRSPVEDPHPELDGISLTIGSTSGSLSDFIGAVYVHPLLSANSMMVRVVKAINEQFGLSDLPIVTDKVEAIGSNMTLQPTGYTGA